jgi:plastocyanin
MFFLEILWVLGVVVSIVGAKVIRVDVGLNGLTFTPNAVSAALGDVVDFHFHPKNHSVVQSSFDSPCNSSSVLNPIFSGFFPVLEGESVSAFSFFWGVFSRKPL